MRSFYLLDIILRTRTLVLQAHTHQFLGTFGGAGNGNSWGELLRAIGVLTSDAKLVNTPMERILIRLDGLSGNAAPLSDVLTSGLGVIARRNDYHLLDLLQVQAVLAHEFFVCRLMRIESAESR
ncbi:MAG TPA: hypothetical protein VGF67_01100 [Ktedonobacteraceae bacterium]